MPKHEETLELYTEVQELPTPSRTRAYCPPCSIAAVADFLDGMRPADVMSVTSRNCKELPENRASLRSQSDSFGGDTLQFCWKHGLAVQSNPELISLGPRKDFSCRLPTWNLDSPSGLSPIR